MRSIYSFFLLPICLYLSFNQNLQAQSASTKDWKIGISKANITPQEPVWMGGYAFRNHPSEGKITDIWAKVVALEDIKGNKGIIITLDLHTINKRSSDYIKDKLQERLDLTKSQIIINASHTHTGPLFKYDFSVYKLFNDSEEQKKTIKYVKETERKIIELAIETFNNMKPGRLYSGNGITRFQVNRHNNTESRLNSLTNLRGPNDYAVPVIRVENEDGGIIAILFGYACHNTTLRKYKFSGDYAGFAQIELEKNYPGATALFFQGAGGDQNPLPRVVDPDNDDISLAVQYGKELAAAVETVVNGEMRPLSNRLSVEYSEIGLPYAKSPPTKEELKQIIAGTSAKKYPDYLMRKAETFLDILNKGDTLAVSYIAYPVQLWQIGEQPVFALGGELTTGYSIDLKRIFGENIFVMGYSNDVMSYIPTAQMLREGGYEVQMSPMFTSPYAPTIENIIVHQAVELANKLNLKPSLVD